MKKIIFFMLTFTMLFSFCAFADSESEIAEIKGQLKNKTIENYEALLIPLKGDPENFNVRPTDDLNTIDFGDGIVVYKVNFQKLRQDSKKGKVNDVSSCLEEKNKYYFPVIISDREVAMAEIVKENGDYRVLCVSCGDIFDNLINVKENIDLSNAKYVTETNIINGFIVTDGKNESFLDLDSADGVSASKVYSADVAKEFLNRKYNSITAGEYSDGYGENGNDDINKFIIFLIFVFCFFAALFAVKIKKYKDV